MGKRAASALGLSRPVVLVVSGAVTVAVGETTVLVVPRSPELQPPSMMAVSPTTSADVSSMILVLETDDPVATAPTPAMACLVRIDDYSPVPPAAGGTCVGPCGISEGGVEPG